MKWQLQKFRPGSGMHLQLIHRNTQGYRDTGIHFTVPGRDATIPFSTSLYISAAGDQGWIKSEMVIFNEDCICICIRICICFVFVFVCIHCISAVGDKE